MSYRLTLLNFVSFGLILATIIYGLFYYEKKSGYWEYLKDVFVLTIFITGLILSLIDLGIQFIASYFDSSTRVWFILSTNGLVFLMLIGLMLYFDNQAKNYRKAVYIEVPDNYKGKFGIVYNASNKKMRSGRSKKFPIQISNHSNDMLFTRLSKQDLKYDLSFTKFINQQGKAIRLKKSNYTELIPVKYKDYTIYTRLFFFDTTIDQEKSKSEYLKKLNDLLKQWGQPKP